MEPESRNMNLGLGTSSSCPENASGETLYAVWSIARVFSRAKERSPEKEKLREHRLTLMGLIESEIEIKQIANIALAYFTAHMIDPTVTNLEEGTIKVFKDCLAHSEFFKKYLPIVDTPNGATVELPPQTPSATFAASA